MIELFATGKLIPGPNGYSLLPIVEVELGNSLATHHAATALIDTGAMATIIDPSLAENLDFKGGVQVQGVGSSSFANIAEARIRIGKLIYNGEVVVRPLEGLPVLLGMDVLRHTKLVIDGPSETVEIFRST